MPKTELLVPTWEACLQIMLNCVEHGSDPSAQAESREGILQSGRMLDFINEQDHDAPLGEALVKLKEFIG